AFNYLIKPVNKEKLETVIKDAIDQIETETTANEAVAKVNRMEKDNLILRQKQGKAIINDLIQCQNNQVIKEIIIFMNNNFSQDISLDAMANKAKMNPYYFSVYFKKNSGLKFKDCLTRIRLEHAMLMLKQSDIKTWELAEKVGFTDPQYFSALFKKYFGKTPMEFKKE
ncbi:MAG: DNA-binding response regulator, partial [Treponema sp.]|nr:DNA-binding response regulator [Treponema sp.]